MFLRIRRILNPIKQAFSKLNARSRPSTRFRACCQGSVAWGPFNAPECRNLLRHTAMFARDRNPL
jgi:hypothetical protein